MPALAASAQPPSPLEIHHLVGGYYVYTTYGTYQGAPVPSNSAYVVTGKGVVMIDTPWDSTQFQSLMDSIEARHHQPVVLCIATHFHDDRTGGLNFLAARGIPTYSSAQTRRLCLAHEKPCARFSFTNDTTFHIGGYTFDTFWPGHGHTPDNIIVWCPRLKVLYGGCFVKSTEATSLGNLEDADTSQWPNSIRAVMRRYPRAQWVIPGHQGWAQSGLQHTLDLLLENSEPGNIIPGGG